MAMRRRTLVRERRSLPSLSCCPRSTPAWNSASSIFQVTFRLRFLVWAFVVIDLIGLVFYEIPNGTAPLGLTPSAHLGGMLAGWLFFRFVYANNGWERATSFSGAGAGCASRAANRTRPRPAAAPQAPWRSGNLRADVDRILDKINSHGFGSLSDERNKFSTTPRISSASTRPAVIPLPDRSSLSPKQISEIRH
jgi:hypothetical protein